jgi:hypothetical protein
LNYFNYFSEIEETFVRRRGRNLLLSPLDWALIETWQERGVPLHVVLRGIETVFDGIDQQQQQPSAARKRNVKSLSYCKEEIEAQYSEWLERQVGKNGTEKVSGSKLQVLSSGGEALHPSGEELFSVEAIENHLERVGTHLQRSMRSTENKEWRETLEEVVNQLTKMRKNISSSKNLEEELEMLEESVNKNLLKFFGGEKIKKEIEKQIAPYQGKMEKEVYQKTFDLMLLKRLREDARIPRLTLFYL